MNLVDDPGAAPPPAPIGFNDADTYYQRSSPSGAKPMDSQKAITKPLFQDTRYSPLKYMFNNGPAPARPSSPPPSMVPPEDEHLSPWLSNEIGGLQEKYRWMVMWHEGFIFHKPVCMCLRHFRNKSLLSRNAQTDTYELDKFRDMEIRRLQEQIEDLECDNKVGGSSSNTVD